MNKNNLKFNAISRKINICLIFDLFVTTRIHKYHKLTKTNIKAQEFMPARPKAWLTSKLFVPLCDN